MIDQDSIAHEYREDVKRRLSILEDGGRNTLEVLHGMEKTILQRLSDQDLQLSRLDNYQKVKDDISELKEYRLRASTTVKIVNVFWAAVIAILTLYIAWRK